MSEVIQWGGLIVAIGILTIKEVYNSNGRRDIHKRINKMHKEFVSNEMCKARGDLMDEKLDNIIGRLDRNGLK